MWQRIYEKKSTSKGIGNQIKLYGIHGFVVFAVWCETNTIQSLINEDARCRGIFLRKKRRNNLQRFDAFYRKKVNNFFASHRKVREKRLTVEICNANDYKGKSTTKYRINTELNKKMPDKCSNFRANLNW